MIFWPKAFDDSVLSVSDETKARIIIELFVEENLTSKKFLDFGCGEGCRVIYAHKCETKLSVGYDFKEHVNWKKCDLLLSTNLNEIYGCRPFDVILAFDILNHVQDPHAVFKQISDLLSIKGKIYLRTHPWTSRHATHDVENKAYSHLLNENNNGMFHNKIPINSSFFKNFGFKVVKERFAKQEIEGFFSDKLKGIDEVQFVDYILQREIKL